MKAVKFTAPSHWAVALINGDESVFEYYENEDDYAEYVFCIKDLIKQYGNAHVTADVTDLGFCLDGDYGSLAGDYSEFTLLIEGENDDEEDEDEDDEDDDEGEEENE